jgi:hypothetical protein
MSASGCNDPLSALKAGVEAMARTNAQPNASKALVHITARVEDLFEVFIVGNHHPMAGASVTQASAAQLHNRP